jgi:hypothetical protein
MNQNKPYNVPSPKRLYIYMWRFLPPSKAAWLLIGTTGLFDVSSSETWLILKKKKLKKIIISTCRPNVLDVEPLMGFLSQIAVESWHSITWFHIGQFHIPAYKSGTLKCLAMTRWLTSPFFFSGVRTWVFWNDWESKLNYEMAPITKKIRVFTSLGYAYSPGLYSLRIDLKANVSRLFPCAFSFQWL